MNKNIFAPILCGGLMLLSACASTSSQTSTPQVNEKSTMSSPATAATRKDYAANPNTEMARVFVVRDFAAPIPFKAHVKIDGEKIGGLKNAQYLETYVAPGDYVLSVSFTKLSMARGAKQNINVAAGETYAWELESDLGLAMAGVYYPRLTPFDPEANPFKISDQTEVKAKK